MIQPAQAESIEGRVIWVTDGDTLVVIIPGRQEIRIRLVWIDAPELKQAYGDQSKRSLSLMTLNQWVRVVDHGYDRYGRLLGQVYVGSLDVNAEQVRRGMAWVYRKYAPKGSPLLEVEQIAKMARLGLWSDPHPIPPCKYRHGVSEKMPRVENFRPCGSGKTCGDMRDCTEAVWYLKRCGLRELDRDGDGLPCESLCK